MERIVTHVMLLMVIFIPVVGGHLKDQMVCDLVRTLKHFYSFLLTISGHQWLQLDLGPPTLVTGIVTRGRGDKKNWVTSYSVSYSNDTKLWFYYKDANHLEAKVDNSSVSQNYHVSCGDPPQSVTFKCQ